LSTYQESSRRAWESGEYTARTQVHPAGGDDPQGLRSSLRAKMEWIVERESYDVMGAERPRQEGPTMKLAQHVKFREEKFGGVLFETRSERVFTLSPTGAAVVREIVQCGGDDESVVQRLKARYQDPDGGLIREAEEFIGSLRKSGLVAG
jgi:hypothetical protein